MATWPVLSASVGLPVTLTGSEKLTVTWTVSPALYDAVRGVDVTFVTVEAVVSMTMSFAFASAPVVPLPVATVVTASFAAASRIVAPFRLRAFAAAASSRDDVSPA